MRKKQRYLIISLPQSSGGCLRIPSSLRWKLMMGRWMKPPQSRKRWLMTCLANKTFTMDSDRIHPRVMRELEKDLAKPLCNIYQQSWLTGEIPDGWNLAKVTPIYKNIWKDDPGKYRPYHGSRQDMEEIIWVPLHMQNNQDTKPSQSERQVLPDQSDILVWQADPFL